MGICMKRLEDNVAFRAKFLTLLAALLCTGCSVLHEHSTQECKSHAYVRTILKDYLSTRFRTNAQPRMAIIPFTTAANLSGREVQKPSLGSELAWKVHARMLDTGDFPIVEVLNRQDWPGKKDEFFTGNFGALQYGREAGYDLVMVGYLENLTSLDKMSAYVKIIEIETGITLWYGKTTVATYRPELQRAGAWLGIRDERPDQFYIPETVEGLAACIARDVTEQDAEPS